MPQSTCSVDDCEGQRYGHGFCSKHWKRWRKYGTPDLPERALLKDSGCAVVGCDKPHAAATFCSAHYTRLRRYGSAEARIPGEVVDGKKIFSKCGFDTPLRRIEKSGSGSWCLDCCAKNMRAKYPYKPKVTGTAICIACGLQFLANKKKLLHCSAECHDATLNRRNWKHLQARRARLKEAFVESFSREEILTRDGWVCGICGQSIDPSFKLPNQMSASIDHIIPIARGGTHERANVQAAHLACNVSKGAKIAS